MNVKKLIEKIEGLNKLYGEKFYVALDDVLDLVKQLDEPETGHADEAPRYVKNILARLRELPLHDREVWLKAIMGEFEQDFSHTKWREGYEQGKFEGAWVGNQLKDADKIRQELNKPVIPHFVADWIEKSKTVAAGTLKGAYINAPEKVRFWWSGENVANVQVFARAWLDGYEVEKEKRYQVKMKGIEKEKCYLNYNFGGVWLFYNQENFYGYRAHHTRKELEEAGFGWIFSCEGIEVEEVD